MQRYVVPVTMMITTGSLPEQQAERQWQQQQQLAASSKQVESVCGAMVLLACRAHAQVGSCQWVRGEPPRAARARVCLANDN